jgi:hypothetical protein
MVEQRTENPRVGGSIPPLTTTFFAPKCHKREGEDWVPSTLALASLFSLFFLFSLDSLDSLD